MRQSLADVRRRVERLATQLGAGACERQHFVAKVSIVWEDEPVPTWPAADASTRCVCGQRITYRHIVHICRWQS